MQFKNPWAVIVFKISIALALKKIRKHQTKYGLS